MRKAFLAPPVVLALCAGLYGCGGGAPHQKTKAEEDKAKVEVADTEQNFQTTASSDEYRAQARQAVIRFIGERFGAESKVHGLHSVPSEGGTFRISADVGIGQKREILRFEAIRFFPEKTEHEGGGRKEPPNWQVILLSATDKGAQGDPGVFERLKTPDAPRAEPAPAAPVATEPPPAAPAAEPTPGASAPP